MSVRLINSIYKKPYSTNSKCSTARSRFSSVCPSSASSIILQFYSHLYLWIHNQSSTSLNRIQTSSVLIHILIINKNEKKNSKQNFRKQKANTLVNESKLRVEMIICNNRHHRFGRCDSAGCAMFIIFFSSSKIIQHTSIIRTWSSFLF